MGQVTLAAVVEILVFLEFERRHLTRIKVVVNSEMVYLPDDLFDMDYGLWCLARCHHFFFETFKIKEGNFVQPHVADCGINPILEIAYLVTQALFMGAYLTILLKDLLEPAVCSLINLFLSLDFFSASFFKQSFLFQGTGAGTNGNIRFQLCK